MNSLRTCAKRFEVSSCGTINPCGSIGFYSIPLNESTRFNLLECKFGITERLDVVLVSQLLINALIGKVENAQNHMYGKATFQELTARTQLNCRTVSREKLEMIA
jgi:hypothetical protein